MVSADMSRIERYLLIVALIFIIIIAVKMTAYIVSLILMALILTMLGIPAQIWLKKKGLSDFASTVIITLAACLIILGFVGLTALSINTLVADLPQYPGRSQCPGRRYRHHARTLRSVFDCHEAAFD